MEPTPLTFDEALAAFQTQRPKPEARIAARLEADFEALFGDKENPNATE